MSQDKTLNAVDNKGCHAVQNSDSMDCWICQQTWDVNDPNPPPCRNKYACLQTVPELLRDGATTYEERQKQYGENYKHYGEVMLGLFPNGLVIRDEGDWNRLGLIHNCVTKLGRYCNNITTGHKDSAHDLMVYAAMLEEMTP